MASLPILSVDRMILKTFFYGIIEFRNRNQVNPKKHLDVETTAAEMADAFERGVAEYSEKLLNSIVDEMG